MPRGGHRPGAGRPVGSKSHSHQVTQDTRRLIEDAIRRKSVPLINKALALALAGDREMIKYALDRILGKPKEQVEHGGSVEHKGVVIMIGNEPFELWLQKQQQVFSKN